MRGLIPVLLALSFAGTAGTAGATQLQLARTQPSVDLSGLEPRMASLSPSLRDWVTKQARATLDRGAAPDPELIAVDARARLDGQDFFASDIETLVQLVMMECVRQADADLRGMMEQMRAANERKRLRREQLSAQKDTQKRVSEAGRVEFSRAPAKIIVAAQAAGSPEASDRRDSLSEMSEMDQLRMQMYMDRMTKADSAASNQLKKFSDVESSIISNLK